MNCSRINVRFTPVWDGERIARVGVRIHADVRADAGETLFSINRRVTNKSFVRLDGDISMSDESGALPCQIQTEALIHADVAQYTAERNTCGTLTIAYIALPEAAGANPCFDLGCEPGGISGSGMLFLPVFEDMECQLTVEWNTSSLPTDFRCVWTYGVGNTTVQGLPSMLTESFYYVGRLKSAESEQFGFYWFKSETYDLSGIAEWNRDTFQVFSRFFRNEHPTYRIFVRRAHDYKPGGTALGRSYMMISPADQKPVMNKFLFAHEMVHNWIKIHDEPFGTCTWYMEGMAEYYSAMLLWRYGLISKAELIAEMNQRARQYYENPQISVSNEEAGALLFADRDVTRVPYGRGLFYLMKVDAQVQRATNGQKTLDDIMFSMVSRFWENPKTGNQDWMELLCEILGDTAAEEFAQMQKGEPVKPPTDGFAHTLHAYRMEGVIRGSGTPCELWQFR